MRVIVDSLSQVKAALEREFAGVMERDVRLRANGKLDSALIVPPGANVPGFLPVTSPMLALRQTQATVTMYIFRLENLERQIDQYLVEINKKYSIPVACLVFVLVGVPLGIMSRRGGFGVAATLSLGFFVLYWACLIGGEKLADRDIVQPFVGHVDRQRPHRDRRRVPHHAHRAGDPPDRLDFLSRLVPRRWRTRLQDELREDEVEA